MFFFPKLIEQRQSKFSGTIKVYKLFGKYSLSVDNLTQSGGLVKSIWRKGLKGISNFQLLWQSQILLCRTISNCLILGLGGGTIVYQVRDIWPDAKITAVEVDSVMVDLGREYFKLNEVDDLKIVVGDAFKIIANYQLPIANYDLVLIDLYKGKEFPKQASSIKFIQNVKSLLTKNGTAIINRLNYLNNEEDIKNFILRCEQVFPRTYHKKVLSNILVFCSNSG